MPRPGFVHEIDERTPPVLMVGGTDLRLERFPLGTRVAYPADAEASKDPSRLLDAALEAPISGEPLAKQIGSCKTLTIVFGDGSTPVPPMRYDIRREVVERVLEIAARAGVNDVVLIAANGLRRRLTESDLVGLLGDRVVRSFAPEGLLRSHDVTDVTNLTSIGDINGQQIKINSRLAESDLIVNIVVRCDSQKLPMSQLVGGLTDEQTIDYVAGLSGIRDPQRGVAVAELIHNELPVITIEVVLGRPLYERPLQFLGKREWEWSFTDQLTFAGIRQVVNSAPKQVANMLFSNLRADYAVLDIVSGKPHDVDKQCAQVWETSDGLNLPEDSDILVTSVWAVGREVSDPVGSPLEAANQALTRRTGRQIKMGRLDGALIAYHPLRNNFSNRHNSAAADFFADVLPDTRDPDEIFMNRQERFINDPWYLELYQTQFAYHPLHVFHQWYTTHLMSEQYADVIWVGGDRHSAAVLGHRAATTFADALEIAANQVGYQPKILVLR